MYLHMRSQLHKNPLGDVCAVTLPSLLVQCNLFTL